MPLRPSMLSTDALDVGADLDLRSQLESAISSIKLPTMLDDGINQIKSMAAMPMQFSDPEPMKIPDLRETMPGYGVEPEQMQQASAPAAFSGRPQAMPSSGVPVSFQGGKNPEGQQRVYQSALASGRNDEDARILAAVTETEGGWGGVPGDNGQSHGVYQFHERGEMPAFKAWLQQQGIQGDPYALAADPDVATRYAATTYLGRALDEGRRQGLTGSALATFVQRTGQRSVDPEATGRNYERLYGGQQQPSQTAAPQGQAAPAGEVTPDQFKMARGEGLDEATAEAVCGPAAAIAFARSNGRQPTMREALELAKQVGWTTQGMAGPQSQVELLKRMGIAATLTEGEPDWQKVRADVQRGNPVTLSSAGHYFVVERVDPDTGMLDLGNSALVLRASKGRRWFRPEEIPGLGMGNITAAIYKDSPSSPAPSVVAGRSGY
jgi:hypothetical protein